MARKNNAREASTVNTAVLAVKTMAVLAVVRKFCHKDCFTALRKKTFRLLRCDCHKYDIFKATKI